MLTKEQYQEFAVAFPDCDLDKAIDYVKSKTDVRDQKALLKKILKEDKHKYKKQEVQEHTNAEKPKSAKEQENAEAHKRNAAEAFKAEHTILYNRYDTPSYNYRIEGTGTIEERSCIERALREAYNPETGFECTYDQWMQREYAIFARCYQNFDIDFDAVIKAFCDNLTKWRGVPLHIAFPDYFTYRCRKAADVLLKMIPQEKPDRINILIRNGTELLEALIAKQKEEIQQVKNDICQPVLEEVF